MSTKCQLYPPCLPAAVLNDPKRRAERDVYNALGAQLVDPKFCVFYSKDWLNTKLTELGQQDGECDFIVAHPELGMLFIEVKGGKIRKDGRSGQWYSGPHSIKDPVRQARTSKHVVVEALRSRWKGKMPFLKAVHCVLLPDSSIDGGYLGEGLPFEIFGFMDDISNLAQKIYSFYDFEAANDGRISGKLGDAGIYLLKEMFAKNLDFSARLKSTIQRDSYLIEQRTDEQKQIIEAAARMERVLIEGPAGSGKTVLAVHRAISRANSNDNDGQVLFTCFSAPLARYLRNCIPDDQQNLLISNFHSFCRNLVLDSGVLAQSEIDSDPVHFFGNVVSYALKAIEVSEPTFDCIIVDEGQDFSEDWWDVIELVVGTRLWVFRDDNQRIRQHALPNYLRLQGPLTLSHVVRNTQRIGEATKHFYRGPNFQLSGPIGEAIVWVDSSDDVQSVEKLIRRYMSYEGVLPSNIAILTVQPVKSTGFHALHTLSDTPVGDGDDLGEKLIVDSVSRFKGLERDVVILCGFGEYVPEDEMLYVAISRAKAHLALVASVRVIDSLKSRILSELPKMD